MSNLLHIVHIASAIWAAAGELITASAILVALNTLANTIRLTYQAGRFTGRLLWPAIHAVIAAARWAHREIDWRLVALVVRDGLVALVALAWLAASWTRQTLITASERLGRCYAAAWVTPSVVVAPVIHPLALVAADLEQLTCKQLRELIGTKRKIRKAELIAMALA